MIAAKGSSALEESTGQAFSAEEARTEERYEVGDIWYRYVDRAYSVVEDADYEIYRSVTKLEQLEYEVVKVTAKGVWIDTGGFERPKRFVLATALRRFAHPSKKEALESYIARKKAQIRIYSNRAKTAGQMKQIAQRELDKITGQPHTENVLAFS